MYELLIGLHVTDNDMYQQSREGMMPILFKMGGGFRYDFTIEETWSGWPSPKHDLRLRSALVKKDNASE